MSLPAFISSVYFFVRVGDVIAPSPDMFHCVEKKSRKAVVEFSNTGVIQ